MFHLLDGKDDYYLRSTDKNSSFPNNWRHDKHVSINMAKPAVYNGESLKMILQSILNMNYDQT